MDYAKGRAQLTAAKFLAMQAGCNRAMAAKKALVKIIYLKGRFP
jgi:hypothetical protein